MLTGPNSYIARPGLLEFAAQKKKVVNISQRTHVFKAWRITNKGLVLIVATEAGAAHSPPGVGHRSPLAPRYIGPAHILETCKVPQKREGGLTALGVIFIEDSEKMRRLLIPLNLTAFKSRRRQDCHRAFTWFCSQGIWFQA